MLIEGAATDLRQENERLRAELQAQTDELRRSPPPPEPAPRHITQRGR